MINQNRNYASVSLCGCTVTNPIREFVIKVVTNPWFDRVILFFILANSVVLALDDPFNPNIWFTNSDYLFLSVFSIEMFLKIIAMGFVMRPYSYLRDSWNIVSALSPLYTFSSTAWSSCLAGLVSSWLAPISMLSALSVFCDRSARLTRCLAWPDLLRRCSTLYHKWSTS